MISATFINVSVLAITGLLFYARNTIAQTDCSRTYVVQAGDTCNSISAAKNVSTYQLANVNVNVINADCTNLFPGETLCLGIVNHDCNITHIVSAGDTCASIADAADTNTTTLLSNNPNVYQNCSNIYPGEVFCTGPVLYYTSH